MPAGETKRAYVTLEAGDRVEGSFSITGGDSGLKFWVEDPWGNAIFAVPELVEDPISGQLADPEWGWASGTHSFGFTAAISGEYALVLSNHDYYDYPSFQDDKQVTLDSVTQYPTR